LLTLVTRSLTVFIKGEHVASAMIIIVPSSEAEVPPLHSITTYKLQTLLIVECPLSIFLLVGGKTHCALIVARASNVSTWET
jgi:hypothetical protein